MAIGQLSDFYRISIGIAQIQQVRTTLLLGTDIALFKHCTHELQAYLRKDSYGNVKILMYV